MREYLRDKINEPEMNSKNKNCLPVKDERGDQLADPTVF
jgi:hypothetical protein